MIVSGAVACNDDSTPAAAGSAVPSLALNKLSGDERPPPVNASCPAGRWLYDYSDGALESLMASFPNAKMLEKEGSFLCTVSEGNAGTVQCVTQGRIRNLMSVRQAGLPMSVDVTMEGSTSMKFTLTGDGKMMVTDSDSSGIKIEAKATVAGKSIPFPMDRALNMFGDVNTVTSYKCEGGNLMLKHKVRETETPWHTLTPSP